MVEITVHTAFQSPCILFFISFFGLESDFAGYNKLIKIKIYSLCISSHVKVNESYLCLKSEQVFMRGIFSYRMNVILHGLFGFTFTIKLTPQTDTTQLTCLGRCYAFASK